MKILSLTIGLILLISPTLTNSQSLDTNEGNSAEVDSSKYEVYSTDLKLEKENYEIGETVKGSFVVHNINSFSLNDLFFEVALVGQYGDGGIPGVYFDVQMPEKIGSLLPKTKQTVNFEYKIPTITTGENLGIQIIIKTSKGKVVSWADANIKISGESEPLLIMRDVEIVVRENLEDELIASKFAAEIAEIELDIDADAEESGSKTEDGLRYGLQHGPTLQDIHTAHIEITLNNIRDTDVSFTPHLSIYERDVTGDLVENMELENVSIESSSQKTFSWNLPKPEKAGVYVARIKFVDSSGKDVTIPIEARYIISGDIFTIVNLTSDATRVKKGDSFNILMTIAGKPIDIVSFENENLPQDIKTSLNIKVSDISGKIVFESFQPFDLNRYDEISIPAKASASSAEMIIKVEILDENGNILAEHVANLPKNLEQDNGVILNYILAILGFVVLIVLILFIKNKKTKIPTVLFVVCFVGIGFLLYPTKDVSATEVYRIGTHEGYAPYDVTINSPQPPAVRSYAPNEGFNLQFIFTADFCNNGTQDISFYSEKKNLWSASDPEASVISGYSGDADVNNLAWWTDNGEDIGGQSFGIVGTDHDDGTRYFTANAEGGYSAPNDPGIYKLYFYVYNHLQWYSTESYVTGTNHDRCNNSGCHGVESGWTTSPNGSKHYKLGTRTVPGVTAFGSYLGYQEVAVDACTNLDEPTQPDPTLVPVGYNRVGTECFITDVCDNIAEEQQSVPAGYIQVGNSCYLDPAVTGCDEGEFTYTVTTGPDSGTSICVTSISNSCESFSDSSHTLSKTDFLEDEIVYYKSTPNGGVPAEYQYVWRPLSGGKSIEDPAGSCLEAKQFNSAAGNGIYWIQTSEMTEGPSQFYCDMTNSGGGWLLVGRGREDWAWNNSGLGTEEEVRNPVTGSGAFPPKYLSASRINQLLNGIDVKDLSNGVYLRRAANNSGTEYQNIIWKFFSATDWSWVYSSPSQQLTSHSVADSILGTGTGGVGTGGYTSDVSFDGNGDSVADNDHKRIWTSSWSGQQDKQGFAYGPTVSFGDTSTNGYGFNAGYGHTTPFTQVLIKPDVFTGVVEGTSSTLNKLYTTAGEYRMGVTVNDNTNNPSNTSVCNIKVHECLVSENTGSPVNANPKCENVGEYCSNDPTGIGRCVVPPIEIVSCNVSPTSIHPDNLPGSLEWTVIWTGGMENFSVDWNLNGDSTLNTGISDRNDVFSYYVDAGTLAGTNFRPVVTIADSSTHEKEFTCQLADVSECSTCSLPYTCNSGVCTLPDPDITLTVDPRIVETGGQCGLTVDTGNDSVFSCTIKDVVGGGVEIETFPMDPIGPATLSHTFYVDPGIYTASCDIGAEIYNANTSIECLENIEVREN